MKSTGVSSTVQSTCLYSCGFMLCAAAATSSGDSIIDGETCSNRAMSPAVTCTEEIESPRSFWSGGGGRVIPAIACKRAGPRAAAETGTSAARTRSTGAVLTQSLEHG